MCEGNRVAGHILSPDIEQPHNVVKFAVNIGLSALLTHHFPQAAEFGFNIFTRVVIFQDHYRMAGKGRTISPYSVREVRSGVQTAFSALHYFFKRFSFTAGDAPSVKTQNASLFHLLIQIFLEGRHAGLSRLHKDNAGSFQLSCGLDEISSVRPQAGLIRADHQCSG